MIQLFKQYPMLAQKLPYVSLGEFPTAVQKLDRLGKYLSFDNLFIKRDDLSGNIYGGNKIRKLEFILGNALRSKAKEVSLKHLNLWDVKARPPPKTKGPPKINEYSIDYSTSQLPVSDKRLYVDVEPACA
jgi:hypothetical protein